MNTRGKRRLRDGREVDIGRNEGLRKVCRCDRRHWGRCPHAWYFNFQWRGEDYRFALDRRIGRRLTKPEAEAEAERIRTLIRAGEFKREGKAPPANAQPEAPMTFREFADVWRARRGYQLVRPADNDSRLKFVCAFVLRGTEPPGLENFQLRDLRHEAASRFEEAGVLTTDVSKFLGHRNLSTTTRYLNTTSHRLRMALLRVEEARAASLANSCKNEPESTPQTDDVPVSSSPSKSLVS